MASETITRTDLTNILNEVLPPTPSEYRKLLWTNPSPTASFSPQSISLDLSDYDEVEVSFINSSAYKYLSANIKCPIGGQAICDGIFGGSAVESGVLFGYARVFSVYTDRIDFGNAAGCADNNSFAIRNEICVPQKIYGIKYDRVAPPLADIEVVSLATKATLYRIGNIRILMFNEYAGANRDLHIDSQDAPNMSIIAPSIVRASTGLSIRMGQINVNSASPYYVNRYYAGTYNNAGEGLSEVSSTDTTSAVAVWSV